MAEDFLDDNYYVDYYDDPSEEYPEEYEPIDLHSQPEPPPPRKRRSSVKKPPRGRKRKKRGGGGMLVFFLIFLLTLAAAGYTIYTLYNRLQNESLARESAEEELASLKAAVAVPQTTEAVENAADYESKTQAEASNATNAGTDIYTHELVEEMLAQARAEGADEREQEIRELIIYSATRDGGGPSTAVRSIIDDYAFYSITGGYEFQKLLDEVPRNDVDWDDLIKNEEDGSICYMPGGVEHSWPMIDVSSYQKEIDWQKVADSGIKYAMLRAGFRGYSKGQLYEDDYIEDNLKGATEAGIKVGVYFFTEAINADEAVEEAQLVLDKIAGYPIDLPVVVDIERISGDTARADQLDKDTRTSVSLTFLNTIQAAGYKPMIYCGIYTYFVQLDQSRIWQYPLWFPFYEDKFYFPYKVACWQYRDNAKVPGISGGVDMSIWLVNPEEL